MGDHYPGDSLDLPRESYILS